MSAGPDHSRIIRPVHPRCSLLPRNRAAMTPVHVRPASRAGARIHGGGRVRFPERASPEPGHEGVARRGQVPDRRRGGTASAPRPRTRAGLHDGIAGGARDGGVASTRGHPRPGRAHRGVAAQAAGRPSLVVTLPVGAAPRGSAIAPPARRARTAKPGLRVSRLRRGQTYCPAAAQGRRYPYGAGHAGERRGPCTSLGHVRRHACGDARPQSSLRAVQGQRPGAGHGGAATRLAGLIPRKETW